MNCNGVVEKGTGDLLRWGVNVDFENDGSLDPDTEEFRGDVPFPGKRRGQFNETQMHRRDGNGWTLVDQP